MRLKMNEFQKLFLIFRLPLNDLHHLNKYKDDHIVIDIEVEEIQKEIDERFRKLKEKSVSINIKM